jgi:hypothetical protein
MFKRKSVALVLVLFVLFSVLVVAHIVLIFFSSQSRLSHHQISRLQAYYAGMAGINYAFEQLRRGAWGEGTYYLADSNFPYIIKDRKIEIEIGQLLLPNDPRHPNQRKVKVRVKYINLPY